MVFSSVVFLFYFLPVALLLYYALPWKNAVLLAVSVVFYAWGEPGFVPLLAAFAFWNYLVALRIEEDPGRARRWLAAGVGVDLLLLFHYKYLGFAAKALSQLVGVDAASRLPESALPLGISFFTFQAISYLCDVHRGEVKAQKNFIDFAMYKAMFPQLIAGPIIRYSEVQQSIDDRKVRASDIAEGLRIFVLGLAQKTLIADAAAVPADRVFALPTAALDPATAWIGASAYALQIFFDFAGYSNMAIGLGLMLGFRFPINFNQPYSAASVTDFWRRWHMSLSRWFRDYVYIPLGGNRASAGRTYLNLAMVFVLCGLWHGAAWTFVVWGAWHGSWLIIERRWLLGVLERWPHPVKCVYTLLIVIVGWVLFRANDMPHAMGYLQAMFDASRVLPHVDSQGMLDRGTAVVLCIGAVLACWPRPTPRGEAGKVAWRNAGVAATVLGSGAILLLSLASIAAGTYSPFIYFRF